MTTRSVAQTVGNVFRPDLSSFVQGTADEAGSDVFADQSDAEQELILSRSLLSAAGLSEDYSVRFFAAGRMGIFAALKFAGVSDGDEVVVTGFTCSVVVNAVMRAGGSPVYADIDPETLGTDPEDVEHKTTQKTKAIIVQHTFGIPCAIEQIAQLARSRGVFLIEDCALAFGSSIGGHSVGSWGDAAVFSFDHSKPINTLIGGALVSNRSEMFAFLDSVFRSDSLEPNHIIAIHSQLRFESRWQTPVSYRNAMLAQSIRRLIHPPPVPSPFLLEEVSNSYYPYPANYPRELRELLLSQLASWLQTEEKRREYLQDQLEVLGRYDELRVPSGYRAAGTVPLRVSFFTPFPKSPLRNTIAKYLDYEWIWFNRAVINSSLPLSHFRYEVGMCPKAEQVSDRIINWPSNYDSKYHDLMIDRFTRFCADIVTHRGTA